MLLQKKNNLPMSKFHVCYAFLKPKCEILARQKLQPIWKIDSIVEFMHLPNFTFITIFLKQKYKILVCQKLEPIMIFFSNNDFK